MAQTANIRAFRRTNIPPVEKIIGGSVLVLLLGIGTLVYLKGKAYDPNTYTGDAEALESTRQAVEGKAATIRASSDLRSYELAGAESGSAAAAAAGTAIPPLTEGLKAMGETEFYNEETLYEKINGRAPAYLEYNFQKLTARSFTIPALSGQYLDLYLYEMDSPLNAFGIFSAERDPGGQPVDFAMDGYRSEMGYFLRHGSTYVQILASSTDAAVMDMARKFAAALPQILEADNSGLEGRALLPSENQIPGTLNYINDNAYGQAVLSGVFEAAYKSDGEELTLFAQATDAETAAANWESLHEFYSKYGTVEEPFNRGDATVFVADMFGQLNVIYYLDSALSGVINAPSRESAIAFVNRLLPEADSASDSETGNDDYPY